MRFRLTRKGDGAVLTILRDDASTSCLRYRDAGFFATHDLLHYAVESTLEYSSAFLGLLAQGHDIGEWEDPRSPLRVCPPREAMWAEVIVSLLHLRARADGAHAIESAQDEINADVARYFQGRGDPPVQLTAQDIRAIATRYEDLLQRWGALPLGATLDLPWPAVWSA